MHQHIRDIKLIIFPAFGFTYIFAFHLRLFIETELKTENEKGAKC